MFLMWLRIFLDDFQAMKFVLRKSDCLQILSLKVGERSDGRCPFLTLIIFFGHFHEKSKERYTIHLNSLTRILTSTISFKSL